MSDDLLKIPDECVEVFPDGSCVIRTRDERIEHLEQIVERQNRVLLYIVDHGRHEVGWLSGECLESCAVCAAASALRLEVRDVRAGAGAAPATEPAPATVAEQSAEGGESERGNTGADRK